MGNKYHLRIFWVVLGMSACLIMINGITSEVSLGDESHHYRFAQNIFWTGQRVPFDPLYTSGNPPGFFYNAPPLWHIALSYLWKMTGGISQAVAQLYHVLFFILLVWVTASLAKDVAGEEARGASALMIATVPMVVSFSTLFYMDVPMAALCALSFYLILQKRYLGAGVASGLAYFTKLNFGFFLPGFLFVVFWNERKNIWGLLKKLSLFTLPVLVTYFLDHDWRNVNIPGQMNSLGWNSVSSRISIIHDGTKWGEYLNSHLTNPVDLAKYFGVALPFLMFFYLVRIRQWDKRAAVVWVPVVSYLASFMIIFGIQSDIRYLLPILPFLVVFFAVSFRSLGNRLRFVIIAACILQFISTAYYVHQKRQLPVEVKEGFEYMRKNVSEDALILYPEENLLIYGGRRVIWSAVGAVEGYRLAKQGLASLLWPKSVEEMRDILRANQIDYILIKKSRVYEDRQEHHIGGYPKSFVEKLPLLDGWMKIFENPGMELWKRVIG